jgi:APA family basic amino acid/polyamine antiporter
MRQRFDSRRATRGDATLNDQPRLLGFWMCVALVVGNMIGSGVFLLPASLAPYGLNSVPAWLLTAGGALFVAVVFAALGRAFPNAGGPYAFTRMAFGEMAGFVVAWGYWVSIWVGNAAIATGAVSYLSNLVPQLAQQPYTALATVALVWLFTIVNIVGVRTAGVVQVVTTVLKIMPLIAIAALGVYLLFAGHPAIEAATHSSAPFRLDAITAAATLTLWALLGLECATVPAGKVKDPERTIPRATMLGTTVTAVIYVLSCTTVLLLIPAAQLAQSNAPFADVAAMFWGETAASLVAAFAAISAMGALNGWILMHGELPFQMARQRVFPALFAKESRQRTPVASLVIGSALISVMVLLNSAKTTVALFSYVVLLSTTASLVMYFVCSLAALKLMRDGRLPGGRMKWGLAVCACVAALYSLWAIAGAGVITGPSCGTATICWAPLLENPIYLGFVLLALGIPLFVFMRRRGGQAPPKAEDHG